jgi:hypothetical protein
MSLRYFLYSVGQYFIKTQIHNFVCIVKYQKTSFATIVLESTVFKDYIKNKKISSNLDLKFSTHKNKYRIFLQTKSITKIMPASTTSKFLKTDMAKLIEAMVEGTIDFNMTGASTLAIMNNIPHYQHFGERFTVKQITNALGQIKKQATSPQELKNQTVEKMKLDNELSLQFGTFFLNFLFYFF